MHEISVLYEIVESAEKIAVENGADRVAFIALDVGRLSGMLPYFFENYFPIVIENRPLFKETELRITEEQGLGKCNDCGDTYDVRKHEGYCPNCKSRNKTILSGNSLIIKEVGLEMPAE